MNKLITLILLTVLAASFSFAKEVKVDIDAKRTQSAYVNLASPDVVLVDNTNWDLAFMTPLSAAIRINDGQGVRLWHVTDGGIADFDAPLDTTGKFETWTELFNSTDVWQIGAFNMGLDGFSDDNPGEFGWGQYAQTIVTGTELFVIKLRNGEYKKIAIDELSAGTFYFFYSDLNNENQESKEFVKSHFSGKLNGYFDLQKGESLDREPAMDLWHLEYSKYVQIVEGQGVTQPYPVVGVRTNRGVKVAQLDEVDVVDTPQPKQEDFTSIITEIGHDWKELNFSTFEYEVIENRVYFVQKFELQQVNDETVEVPVGQLYKLVFKGFAGGEMTYEIADPQLSVNETNYDNSKFAVYPNIISKNETVNLVYAGSDVGQANLNIYSSTGATVHTQDVNLTQNIQISNINTSDFNSGVYFVRIQKGNSIYTQKFVVR
ncbi:MAG: T9SS type A sorting domain-containing protein [Candidatus Kapaibacterium sp.]